MKKNIVLFTVVLLLAAIGYWLSEQQLEGEGTYSGNIHTSFAIEDVSVIERVFLTNRKGERILLEKQDGYWMFLNQVSKKSYKVNPNAIHYFLETLRRIRVRNAVAQAALPNVVSSMASNATKIEIYGAEKVRLKTYYMGAMTDGGQGNFIKMEGSEQIYIGYIPNFQGTLDTRFSLIEEEWRDKAFVRLNPSDLEFLELAYQEPSQRKHSFRIEMKGKDGYTVKPLAGEEKAAELLNVTNVKAYVNDCDVFSAERILENKFVMDSVLGSTPFVVLSYKTKKQNQPQRIIIYSLLNPSADRGDGIIGVRNQIQRYFVYINQDHFYLAQHLVLRRLLWGYDFFFKQSGIQLEEDEAVFKENIRRN
jgi:hypothetical protein